MRAQAPQGVAGVRGRIVNVASRAADYAIGTTIDVHGASPAR